MMDSNPQSLREELLRFGPFELSIANRELRRDGRLVEIGHRGMDLLVALVSHAGEPVSKARLIQAAWGGRAVEQSNLTVQIATLRRQLDASPDDSAETRPMIRTVPGYGYIFAAPVTRGPGAPHRSGSPSLSRSAWFAAATDHGWIAEPLTLFVGREKERRALTRLLPTCRLLTLTGLGGVGKTRLAKRLSHELAPLYADGITLVDLAPLNEARQVDEAVATALGAGGGEATAEVALIKMLHGRQLLLIIDNAEHLSDPVIRLLGQVLGRCPLVSVLVTSRNSLGLPGEIVFRLSPLDLPPEGRLTADEALTYDSVRLFVDRAQALLPGFSLDDSAASDAAEICRRLDGIALAIEMAVPRLEVLSLRQLADRIQDRFDAVAVQRHNVFPRQRTLRTMFDWSWELLSPRERRLLQLLAISPAGTGLGTLEALAAADETGSADRNDVVDRLTRLTQSSLVVVTLPGQGGSPREEARYRLLETTRQYALEHLPPAERTELSRLYAQLVAALFERAEAEWPTTNSAVWLDRYGPDADNLRSCLQWAFAFPDDSELALRLTAASFSLWWELPGLPLREASGWYALALTRVGSRTPPCIEARLRLGHAWTDTLDGNIETFATVERAVQLFRMADDPAGLGAALWRAASVVLFREHVPCAHALITEALHVLARLPPSKWQALCHVREADLLLAAGALLPALAKYDQALVTIRALGYGYGLMVCESNRSYTLFALGRRDEAISALHGLLPKLQRGLQHPVLSLLAITLAACEQDEQARTLALKGLGGTVTIGMTATLARSVEALALLTARSGDSAAAARFLGFVLARHPPERTRLGPRRAVFERLLHILEGTLSSSERERLLTEGASWTADEAVEMVEKVCATAEGR